MTILKKPSILVAAALFATAGLASAQTAGQIVGQITITNLTGDHILSPAVVATHNMDAAAVYTPGEPASSELTSLAEEGRGDPLAAMLMADPGVLNVVHITGAGGPIMPGESATATIGFDYDHPMISVAAMLVSTNDGFIAARVMIPARGSRTYMVGAWDAGTEANTESCMHVPGPPCGTHDGRMTDGAEGFVHIHRGIRGTGGVPASKDWRNPVAMITVTGASGTRMGNKGGRR